MYQPSSQDSHNHTFTESITYFTQHYKTGIKIYPLKSKVTG
jgi:hypothetical protein